jgi:hypothetical protein
LCQKRKFLRRFFGKNNLKIITSVPGKPWLQMRLNYINAVLDIRSVPMSKCADIHTYTYVHVIRATQLQENNNQQEQAFALWLSEA